MSMPTVSCLEDFCSILSDILVGWIGFVWFGLGSSRMSMLKDVRVEIPLQGVGLGKCLEAACNVLKHNVTSIPFTCFSCFLG